jgi:hypothetical protein
MYQKRCNRGAARLGSCLTSCTYGVQGFFTADRAVAQHALAILSL